jgi:hypothetical protein
VGRVVTDLPHTRRLAHRTEAEYKFVALVVSCSAGHYAGLIFRQRGKTFVEPPMEEIAVPNGSMKVRLRCKLCATDDRQPDSQMRGDRLERMLDELEASPSEVRRSITFP